MNNAFDCRDSVHVSPREQTVDRLGWLDGWDLRVVHGSRATPFVHVSWSIATNRAAKMIRALTSCFLFLAGLATATAANETFQPRDVITVEAYPSRMVFGSLSMPLGAPWCQGMPGYWLIALWLFYFQLK